VRHHLLPRQHMPEHHVHSTMGCWKDWFNTLHRKRSHKFTNSNFFMMLFTEIYLIKMKT
jgi:hypothetical protein